MSSLMATNYNIDKSHTNIGFKIKYMMISNINEKFNDFEGTYSIDEKTNSVSSLNGIIKINSITTDDTDRDTHLKSEAFFNAEKYPLMSIVLVKQNATEALVKLTIKDTTRIVKMSINDISKSIKDPWSNIRTGFVLEDKIDRQDFNIKFNKILEAEGILVKSLVAIYENI